MRIGQSKLRSLLPHMVQERGSATRVIAWWYLTSSRAVESLQIVAALPTDGVLTVTSHLSQYTLEESPNVYKWYLHSKCTVRESKSLSGRQTNTHNESLEPVSSGLLQRLQKLLLEHDLGLVRGEHQHVATRVC